MKSYLIVSLIVLLAMQAQSIDYCMGCVTTNFTYTCNGRNCEGFQFTTNSTHPIIQGIDCKGGKSPCYVRDRYDNATSTEYWIACNSSVSGCGSCFQKADCTTCYPGMHLYNYDIENDKHICRACSDSISGCIKCANGQVCQLCQDPYRLMNDGLCHNKDGTLVDGQSSSTTGIFVLLIIITIFLGLGLLMYGFSLKNRLAASQRQESLLSS